MIPTSTGAAKAVSLVLPELKGKFDGISVRVPTPNVSLVDVVIELEKPATKDEVNGALKAAAARNGLTLLSMGMSGDLEAAVAEGATIVRVGTALFGSRPRA